MYEKVLRTQPSMRPLTHASGGSELDFVAAYSCTSLFALRIGGTEPGAFCSSGQSH